MHALQRVLTVAVLLPLFLAALFLLPNLFWGLLLSGVAVGRGAGVGQARQLLWARAAGLLRHWSASCGAILWREHGLGSDQRAFIYSPAGKLSYGAAAVFWLGIAPAWLLCRWPVRGAVAAARRLAWC